MGGGRPDKEDAAVFLRLFLLLFAPSSPPPPPPPPLSEGAGEAPLIDAAAPSEEPRRSLEVGDPAFPVSKPDVDAVVAPSAGSVMLLERLLRMLLPALLLLLLMLGLLALLLLLLATSPKLRWCWSLSLTPVDEVVAPSSDVRRPSSTREDGDGKSYE